MTCPHCLHCDAKTIKPGDMSRGLLGLFLVGSPLVLGTIGMLYARSIDSLAWGILSGLAGFGGLLVMLFLIDILPDLVLSDEEKRWLDK